MSGRIMAKVSIAGLKIDAITRKDFLHTIHGRLAQGAKTFVTTPYSEFLYAALYDHVVMDMLNKADLAIPDGIGILWGQRFLSLPFSVRNYYLKIVQAFWQMFYTGAGILLWPRSIYKTFPEKITGADVIWDIAELAAKNNYSVYLLGSFVPELAAKKLQERYPGLVIAGTSQKPPQDESIARDVNDAKADILLVAYGPIRQEQWIVDHYAQLSAKLMIGLGGTFDYIAGKKLQPPRFIRSSGLEWLYRLITQPTRFKRIVRATLGLIIALIRYKVFESMPMRENVVSVIVDEANRILIGKRNWRDSRKYYLNEKSLENYWQLPQGGIEKGETPQQAAKREIAEETGLEDISFIALSDLHHDYVWDNAFRPLLGNLFKNKGQHQHIVFMRLSNAAEITLRSDEFVEYRWVSAGQLETAVHPIRRPLAQLVLQDIRERKILEKPQ